VCASQGDLRYADAVPRHKAPTVRLRRLAQELRRLRETAGLTPGQVAEATGLDRATLFRIETAKAKPQGRTVRALFEVYGVPEQRQGELVALLKAVAEQAWIDTAASELPGPYATYIGFESEAQRLLNYQTLFVPGLLQSEEYARTMIKGTLPDASSDEVEARVAARLARQDLLVREQPTSLWAVIDEAALLRNIGGRQVMRDQLTRLQEAADMPNITLQVIPLDVGAYPGMLGSFVILQFSDDAPDVVYIESYTSDLFLEGADDIRRYNLVFDRLCSVAASPAATKALLPKLLRGK
jgi:transcriptional regulator with XRE-family HTH domain